MDYVVGSVASLISGNVTPNRPKRLKKPLTPMKHQASPNVTPKSQLVDDKSVFLSPTMQKKKAIVKKSPKRIFQNDLDVTNEEGESNFSSPKADKVKKHLKDELETDSQVLKNSKSPKNNDNAIAENENSSKKKKNKKNSLTVSETEALADESIENNKENNENADNIEQSKSKKRRKRSKSVSEQEDTQVNENVVKPDDSTENKSPKKKRKSKASSEKQECEQSENVTRDNNKIENEENLVDKNESKSPKNKRKRSKSVAERDAENDINETDSNSKVEKSEDSSGNKSPKKKRKKSKSIADPEIEQNRSNIGKTGDEDNKHKNKKKNKKSSKKTENASGVNPNAITNKDSDSEHESDDEMHSENEEENKKTLNTDPAEESSDEEEAPKKKEVNKEKKEDKQQQDTEDEIKRTIFVGNVPFSSKCKKELKKIFNQYGQIETVRIRTVPVKDARVTPKMAVIKNELHPDRTTVNAYIKFADAASVSKALVENNTLLNGCHLRVSRSDSTGAEHDPKCSVFVGNIPFALEDDGLRERFEKCGEIESVRIIRDKKTNAGKGFGYVNFKSKDGVELALALTEEDLTIKNRILRVKRCTQLTHKKLNKQETGKQGYVEKQGYQGRQDKATWNKGNQFNKGKSGQDNTEGAYRRIKRKNQIDMSVCVLQDNSGVNKDGTHTKKNRKEFVGMTAEKKKKQKFNKGQKKKKVLSEILTKK
ncbi:unnamed protein product [Danaus chrysippus]|uniref:(African queen) hypothetical protein n=1 Tax=Danaus chrysippus TaxID=151541 RepID=A0A8J2QWW9_9NEOP|nr:unnamed protein product [Danaus chrysippus]